MLESLLDRMPPAGIVAVTRDPGKATALAERGVTVRAGDFADPDGMSAAFQGADQVLIVSADKLGHEARRLHRAAIDAACNAGARRVLYTGHMGARPGSPFLPANQHAGTEADLATGGIAFTSLRHGFYAESCLHIVGDGLRSGDLRAPEDGPVSWTAREDLAQADAAILASDGAWDGITPPLTAIEALTMADIAAIASDVTGRAVRHTTVTDEEWRRDKIAAGMPALYADMLLGTFRAARRSRRPPGRFRGKRTGAGIPAWPATPDDARDPDIDALKAGTSAAGATGAGIPGASARPAHAGFGNTGVTHRPDGPAKVMPVRYRLCSRTGATRKA